MKCTLKNIHTGSEMEYSFDVVPRVGDCIMIDGIELWDDQKWQDFAGVDENDPRFKGMAIRTYQVCSVNHWIRKHQPTIIEILLDEFFGEKE